MVGDVREALVDLVVGGVDDLEPSERRARRIYDEVRDSGNDSSWGFD
jgi:exosome complex exonuclease DIS3/RRP44